MKKKQIIEELENLYVKRFEDYERLFNKGEYDEARKAFEDAMEVLVKIDLISGNKIKATEIAKLGLDGIVGLGTLGVGTYLGFKTFKFEETGTFSSTGGRTLMQENFKKLSSPKRF